MKEFIDVLRAGSIYISVTGFSLSYLAYLLAGLQPDIRVCLAVCLITYAVYAMDKLMDLKKDEINAPERFRLLASRQKLLKISVVFSFVLSLALAIWAEGWKLGILMLVPALTGYAYSIKLPGIPRLREVFLAKGLIVPFVWAVVCTIPAGMARPELLLPLFVLYFVKIFADCLPYDMRDIKGDQAAGLKTLPVVLGAKRTILIMLMLYLILVPIALLMEWQALGLCFALYGLVYTLFFRDIVKSPIAVDLMVEGQYIAMATGISAWLFVTGL